MADVSMLRLVLLVMTGWLECRQREANRGNRGLLTRFNGAPPSTDPDEPADFGNGFSSARATLVWIGWEFGLVSAKRGDAHGRRGYDAVRSCARLPRPRSDP